MEKKVYLSIFVLLLAICGKADNYFSLATKGEIYQTMPIYVTASSNYSFCPFPSNRSGMRLTGLSIDGSFTRFSKNYLVRILLKDKDGREHLIMENYKEVNNESSGFFSNYCEETRHLKYIQPDSIKIILKGASIQLTKINYTEDDTFNSPSRYPFEDNNEEEARKAQVKDVVKKINMYNVAHNKLWRAGVTAISLKKYEDRKRILGFEDDESTGGIEYYADGIFEIGDIEDVKTSRSRSSSQLSIVDSFDWRSQHGKNWITPNKDQGDSGYCSAFTAVSVTEAMTRLYYNRLIDIDLSEQEAACCNTSTDPWFNGMPVSAPLDYIRDYGVCDELAYPFVNSQYATSCRSSEITPNELISIGGYLGVEESEDSMKVALIKHGPLTSAIYYWGHTHVPDSNYYRHHAMTIVGFGQLQVGDTIYHWIESDGFENGDFTVHEGDQRVGMTYWIYKNNYGESLDSARCGYQYYIHYNYDLSVSNTYYLLPQITSINYTDNDIVCEDADGDGYYFWGLGNKPSWCPDWVPDTKDGDDNNFSKGKMFLDGADIVIGDLETLDPGGTPRPSIYGDVTYNTRQSIYTHLRIAPNATLTIQDILNLFGRVTITIESGGELIIDGGIITNANIEFATGGKLTIRNGGKLVMRTNTDFVAPIGAIVEIENGEICRSDEF